MIPEAAVVLHAGPGHEVTFAGYLFRVVAHLVAVGAVALVLYWSMGRDGPVRTALAAGHDDETVESRE